jgi:hypothetical protein
MTRDIASLPIAERYLFLEKVISSPRFLNMEGLGNEVPFFICPYGPEEGVDMEKMVKQLAMRLTTNGVPILEVNLYDLSIELLRARGIWDRLLQAEESMSKDQLKELLQGPLDAEKHLVPAIGAKMAESDFAVLFIAGVGEVFPYIRSHNVLNNLQSVAKDQPTVLFFPGQYIHSPDVGASLVLFNRLRGDKYYRAFNIYDVEV